MYIGGTKICNLRYADDTVLLASAKSIMASLLEKVKSSNANADLKLNRTNCSILTVDRSETLPVHFALIPDIERKDNLI